MKFYLPDDQETIADAREITGKYQPDEDHMASNFAEDAARWYYSNCDGYEDSWPKKFAVVGNNGNELGVFNVHMDFDPTFWADKLK